jgi:ubiquitin-protein ligase
MAQKFHTKRLQRELQDITKNPLPGIEINCAENLTKYA